VGNRVIEYSYIHTFSYIPHRLDRVWTEIVLVQWRNDQSALVNLQNTYIYIYTVYIYILLLEPRSLPICLQDVNLRATNLPCRSA